MPETFQQVERERDQFRRELARLRSQPTSEEVQKEIHGLRTGWGGKGRDIMLRAADLIERLAAELAKAQEDAERWQIAVREKMIRDGADGISLIDAARAAAIEEGG